MGNGCIKSQQDNGLVGGRGGNKKPIILNMGDQPMSMGFHMGDKFSNDEVKPPQNINTSEEFVAKKEA
jgi:hypothetical protein